MCEVIMSIKPAYVGKILSGEKLYEYRKKRCRRDIDSIIIYSTFPMKKIVAEVKVKGIIEGYPEDVWRKTYLNSGISKADYDEYFYGKDLAVAYVLGEINIFEKPRELQDYGKTYIPQSYCYV